VRVIGITGLSLKNLVAIASRAKVDCMISYCRYNLMIDDMNAILTPFAKEQGIGIINGSPLHMGVLTEHEVPEWHPAPTEIREAGRRVVELCKEHGVSAPLVGLRFCLEHPYVSSTLMIIYLTEDESIGIKICGGSSSYGKETRNSQRDFDGSTGRRSRPEK
jgi:L-galactose dehydrogenase